MERHEGREGRKREWKRREEGEEKERKGEEETEEECQMRSG